MPPGKHSITVGEPLRHQGALRDSIRILMPGPRVLIVALHREPLDGTVVETVLKHGHGALNIDGCRIASGGEHMRGFVGNRTGGMILGSDVRKGKNLGMFETGRAFTPTDSPLGRWPTNVLLVHGSDCRKMGHDAWNCQPDCPMTLLDEMCGDRPGMPLTSRRSGKSPKGYGLGIFPDDASMSPGYGDEGAASRFFPQFKDLDEAMAWIRRLIGGV